MDARWVQLTKHVLKNTLFSKSHIQQKLGDVCKRSLNSLWDNSNCFSQKRSTGIEDSRPSVLQLALGLSFWGETGVQISYYATSEPTLSPHKQEIKMAATTRRKRVSKNTKQSWRKHSDIKDVEEHLEEARREERTGWVFLVFFAKMSHKMKLTCVTD